MVPIREEHEDIPLLTLARSAHGSAGRIGRDAERAGLRVLEHRVDNAIGSLVRAPKPATLGRARQREAVACTDSLLAMQRKAVVVFGNDHVRNRARVSHHVGPHAFGQRRDNHGRRLEGIGAGDRGTLRQRRGVCVLLDTNELYTADEQVHVACRPESDPAGSLLANPLEALAARSDDFVRNDLHFLGLEIAEVERVAPTVCVPLLLPLLLCGKVGAGRCFGDVVDRRPAFEHLEHLREPEQELLSRDSLRVVGPDVLVGLAVPLEIRLLELSEPERFSELGVQARVLGEKLRCARALDLELRAQRFASTASLTHDARTNNDRATACKWSAITFLKIGRPI